MAFAVRAATGVFEGLSLYVMVIVIKGKTVERE